MDKFLGELTTPSWWISVVVVGILVNLFSDYFRRFLEKIYSRYSQKTNEKRTKENEKRIKEMEAFNKEVDSLNDATKLLNAKTDLIYLAILITMYSALYLIALVVVSLTLKSPMFNILSIAISLIMTLWYFFSFTLKFRKAMRLESAIRIFYERQGVQDNYYSKL